MNKLIEFFSRQKLFGDMITVFIIGVGIYSAFTVKREVFPNVSFDIITISTLYPGASPEEVEKLITNPIEQDMQEVDGIKRLSSASVEGRSYIVALLDVNQTTEEKAKQDIKDVVDIIKLPDDAEDPKVVAIESKQQPIIEVAVSADISEIELRKVAKELERKLESISGVSKVVYKGLRDIEIRVDADPVKLSNQSVALDELVQALKFQNQSIPAGSLKSQTNGVMSFEKIIRTIGEFKSLEDVKNTVIRSNDLASSVRIKDVAKVYYDLEKETVVNRTNGLKSISLTVLKKERADAIKVVDAVKIVVDEYKKNQKNISVSFINDFSLFIKNRLSILSTNLIVGLILVCGILSLFLPFRLALVVSTGIFISFFGTLAVFSWMGFSINLISLLGLIIVSGMLIDDAIVVSDNIARYNKMGLPPIEAAIRGAGEIWPAVAASVLTTIVAFLPMMFMSGIFGKFVSQVPLGVVIALLISLFESLLILPQHISSYVKFDFERKIDRQKLTFFSFRDKFQLFWDEKVVPWYGAKVELMVRRRYIVISILLGIFISSIVIATTSLKFILFPPEGVEAFFVRVKAPTGIELYQMEKLVVPIEEEIKKLSKGELKDFVTTVGLMQNDPNDPDSKRGAEYAQIAVYLTPENERSRVAAEIIDELREKIGKPEHFEQITFDRVRPGPPVGKAVSLAVKGDRYEEILPAVSVLKEKLKLVKGTKDIDDSYVKGKEEIQIIVNNSEASAAGLTVASIGMAVRAAVDGVIATSIQELDDEIEIRVSFDKKSQNSNEIISQIQIPNQRGNLIPLKRVATFKPEVGVAIFQHDDNLRYVNVFADVDTDVTSSQAANEFVRKNIIPEMSKEFPKIGFEFGGEDEDTQESFASLLRAFVIAFMAIFLILIMTFKNLLQPFLVILTIPLGIMSVIFAFSVMRLPLSFMAMLGIIALAGVIVNNAIVLIDFVNHLRADGVERKQSIVDAAQIRLRPIFLTTATTVAGLLPTAHGIGGLDKFIVPIAVALGYGLMFGSILTAFGFPAAIAVLDDFEDFMARIFKKKKTAS